MQKVEVKTRRRSFSVLVLATIVTIGALFALPKAQATQPVPVSGTWNVCGHNMWDTFHQAGRNFTINVYQNQNLFGALIGTLYIVPDDPEFDVLHLARDGVTLVRASFHGSGTFVGSVLGRTASPAAVMTYQGRIAPDGSGQAIYIFDDPVAGIHGQLTMLGSPPDPNPCESDGYYVTGTYAGQIQLTP